MMEQQQTYGNLLHDLDPLAREQFRKYEKYRRHLIQSKFKGMFNSICINEKLLPKYSNTNNDISTPTPPPL